MACDVEHGVVRRASRPPVSTPVPKGEAVTYRHAATDPTRPATKTDLRLLGEALCHLHESVWREHMYSTYPGRDRGQLTHGECAEFKAWAVREVLA